MDAIAKQKHPMCQSRQAIGSWTAASIVAGVTALLLPAPAYSLNRCEGRDGHVTYTNEACPPNTRLARRIDTTPAIVTQEPRSAKPAEGALARDETRTAASAGREEREDSKAAKEAAAASSRRQPRRPPTPSRKSSASMNCGCARSASAPI